MSQEPKEGVYVYGLYLENAHWSVVNSELRDAIPGEMSFLMPVIHFLPKVIPGKVEDGKGSPEKQDNSSLLELYSCPVYKTSLRAGVLSTTG